MSEEALAAEADSEITLDDQINNAINDEVSEESAPQEEDAPGAETLEQQAEEQTEGAEPDGVQKRINKVIWEKREAERKAEALQAELEKVKTQTVAEAPKQPILEDFDYDEQAYNDALIDYKIEVRSQEKANALQEQQRKDSKQQKREEAVRMFNDNSVGFAKDKPDFTEVLNKVPVLEPSVLQEVMTRDNGPELAYFLGSHLDIADSIVKMNPVAAGIKIGEISRKLSEPKRIKPSNAPEPIDPLKAGASTSKGRGPAGATFE